jgi:hypothetical protein
MSNNSRVVARSARKGTSITRFFFDVADDGSFREVADGEDVSNI